MWIGVMAMPVVLRSRARPVRRAVSAGLTPRFPRPKEGDGPVAVWPAASALRRGDSSLEG